MHSYRERVSQRTWGGGKKDFILGSLKKRRRSPDSQWLNSWVLLGIWLRCRRGGKKLVTQQRSVQNDLKYPSGAGLFPGVMNTEGSAPDTQALVINKRISTGSSEKWQVSLIIRGPCTIGPTTVELDAKLWKLLAHNTGVWIPKCHEGHSWMPARMGFHSQRKIKELWTLHQPLHSALWTKDNWRSSSWETLAFSTFFQ